MFGETIAVTCSRLLFGGLYYSFLLFPPMDPRFILFTKWMAFLECVLTSINPTVASFSFMQIYTFERPSVRGGGRGSGVPTLWDIKIESNFNSRGVIPCKIFQSQLQRGRFLIVLPRFYLFYSGDSFASATELRP